MKRAAEGVAEASAPPAKGPRTNEEALHWTTGATLEDKLKQICKEGQIYNHGNEADDHPLEFFCIGLEGEQPKVVLGVPNQGGDCTQFGNCNFVDHVKRMWISSDDFRDEGDDGPIHKSLQALREAVKGMQGFQFSKPDPEGGQCNYITGCGVVIDDTLVVGWQEPGVVYT